MLDVSGNDSWWVGWSAIVFDISHVLNNNFWLLLPAALIFGACIGSFLNVVIYRLPIMIYKHWEEQCADLKNDSFLQKLPKKEVTLVKPRSTCPACSTPIPIVHNIPILSYFLLGGKCKVCQTNISVRYVSIEIMAALLCTYIVYRYGVSIHSIFLLIFTFYLLPLAFIDLEHTILPDVMVYILLWVGVIYSLSGYGIDLYSSIVGIIAGYLSLWSVYILFKLTTGKEGMGHGDFKLLAALGAWVGWQGLLTIILISSLLGTMIGIILMIHARIHHRESGAYPFGPFLAIAGWVTLFWKDEITYIVPGISHLIK